MELLPIFGALPRSVRGNYLRVFSRLQQGELPKQAFQLCTIAKAALSLTPYCRVTSRAKIPE
jgi:hypothetical protein